MPHSKQQMPACSTANAAVPDEVICDNCGADIEVWSDETVTVCGECGQTLTK